MKTKLAGVVSVLDEWQSGQQKWTSLVPIFGQYEVQRQLATQTNKFRVVDRRWRATIRNAQRDTRVLAFASSPGLMSSLLEANKVMSGIIQDLDSYLDSKRAVFPRFFFLTNDDLFVIVSTHINVFTFILNFYKILIPLDKYVGIKDSFSNIYPTIFWQVFR